MWRNPKYQEAEQAPPRDEGRKLVAIPRGPKEELRLDLCETDGHPWVGIRVWERGQSGWFPSKRGCSIRPRELAAVLDALRRAADQLDVQATPRPAPAPTPPVGAGRQRWNPDDDDRPY